MRTKRNRKVLIFLALLLLILILTGCGNRDQDIPIPNGDFWSQSEGFWDSYFVFPLSWLIQTVARFLSGSYGWAIVIVTLIFRSILVPLNIKSLKSTQAMQEIQPKIKELQVKYSSKDAKTQEKLQQEQMELYKKYNINPLAGCLPMFIQMPILMGLYQAITRTTALKTGTFLWFDLGIPDPYYILPIIAAGATFLQQRLTMASAGSGQAAANPSMSMMMYMMPVMIGVMSMFFPAALSLYWVVGNVFMVLQTIFIRKPFKFQQKVGGN